MGVRAERRVKQVLRREKEKIATLEKESRTITCKNILKICSECPNHRVVNADDSFGGTEFEHKISICQKKARKNMDYQLVEVESTVPFEPSAIVPIAKIGFYSYGDVMAKCDFLILMAIEDEKN